MRMFKTIAVPALLAGFLLSVSSARAQEVRFDDIDGDADGLLSRTELAAVFGSPGGDILGNDQNGDGVVSRNELLATGERRDDDRSGRLGGLGERDDGSDDDRRDDDGEDDRDDGLGDDDDDDRDDDQDDDSDDD